MLDLTEQRAGNAWSNNQPPCLSISVVSASACLPPSVNARSACYVMNAGGHPHYANGQSICMQKLLQRTTAMAFAGWREGAAECSRKREFLVHAVGHFLHQRQGACFLIWRAATQQKLLQQRPASRSCSALDPGLSPSYIQVVAGLGGQAHRAAHQGHRYAILMI